VLARQTWRIQHVRPGLLIRLEPLDGVREVGSTPEVVLRTPGYRERKRQSARHLHHGTDALDRSFEIVDRILRPASGIFDRAAPESGGGGQSKSLRDGRGVISEAVLEVGADRQVGG